MQIDVLEVNEETRLVTCNLYTGERCVKTYMSHVDYMDLIRDGFFIRTGTQRDSANVLNTSATYILK